MENKQKKNNETIVQDPVPGGVYLCQVNEEVSCGACCGLYNVADTCRGHITDMLQERTRRFSNTARTVSDIESFGRRTRQIEPRQRPFKDFHHCPYLGLIGTGCRRVGCLLHPMADGNAGVDLRGLSYYGGLACRTYFCPATRELESRWKLVLRSVIDDWHFFGLIVTEKDLLSAIFMEIESGLSRPLDLRMFSADDQASRCLQELLRLKCNWPFRPTERHTNCHFFFNDTDYPKPKIPYASLAMPVSHYDTILRELVSEFSSADQVRQAEQLISNKIRAVIQALAESRAPGCHP